MAVAVAADNATLWQWGLGIYPAFVAAAHSDGTLTAVSGGGGWWMVVSGCE